MAYEYITTHNALRFTRGRQGEKIKYIVLHHWGSKGQTFNGIIDWFCKNTACQTSAHYVVEEGKVACIVDLDDTAWHAGNWAYNLMSIGIECRPEAINGDYETVAELIAKIWKHYGKLPIIRHKDVPGVKTACPGNWNINRLLTLVEKYYSNNDTKPIDKSNVPNIQKPSEWAKESWQQAKVIGICDGSRPLDKVTRQETVAMIMNSFNILHKQIDDKKGE